MKLTINTLKNHLKDAAAAYVSLDEAAYFAECMLLAHLRKAPRMNPIKEAVDDLTAWKNQDEKTLKITVNSPACQVMDFQGLPPSLKIKQVHDTLKQKAAECGIAALGFNNSGGITTLAPWADGLARQDLIGIAMFNGGTQCTVPHGGTQGVFGTNPLAYAIPTDDDAICLDMATSEIPFFEIKNAKQDHLKLKEKTAVDSSGVPTTDPQKALSEDGVANLLPMGGGFKGYGIMMLIEVLTGSLVRSLLSTQQTPGWNTQEYGCLLIAIDISVLTDLSEFKQSVSNMCTEIRKLPAAQGFESVSIPGDRGHTRLQAALKAGSIEIDDEVYDTLKSLVKHSSHLA